MRAWWSWCWPVQRPDLGGDWTPELPLGSPLLWQHSLTGLWWVSLRGDSPASHLDLFPFPCQLSKSQVRAFSDGLCISWDPLPCSARGEQTMSACMETPSKMSNFLVLAGSQDCYAYIKKSLWYLSIPHWDCGYTQHICWIFDSAKFICPGGEKS